MDTDGTPVRMTVAQAAQVLGISAEAVRQRVRRGTLPTEKSADGSVFVLMTEAKDPSATERTRTDTNGTNDGTNDKALIARHLDHALDEIRFLREELGIRNEELRRKDHIIAALTERIPELEAGSSSARDERGSPVVDEEPKSSSTGSGAKEEPQGGISGERTPRSRWWWRGWFG